MDIKLNIGRGSFTASKGTTKIEVFDKGDKPFASAPIRISVDGGPPVAIKKEVGFLEIAKNIRGVYTEEELLEYLISLY